MSYILQKLAKVESLAHSTRYVFELLKYAGVRVHLVVMASGLSFVAAVFDGLAFSLLVPLLKGLLDKDFSFLMRLPYLGTTLKSWLGVIEDEQTYLFILLLAGIFCLLSLKVLMQYFGPLILAKENRALASKIRSLVFERYLSFGKLYFDRTSLGQMYQVIVVFTGAVTAQFTALYQALSSFYPLV